MTTTVFVFWIIIRGSANERYTFHYEFILIVVIQGGIQIFNDASVLVQCSIDAYTVFTE